MSGRMEKGTVTGNGRRDLPRKRKISVPVKKKKGPGNTAMTEERLE